MLGQVERMRASYKNRLRDYAHTNKRWKRSHESEKEKRGTGKSTESANQTEAEINALVEKVREAMTLGVITEENNNAKNGNVSNSSEE